MLASMVGVQEGLNIAKITVLAGKLCVGIVGMRHITDFFEF